MITRAQYMADPALHQAYYAQFVSPGLQSFVARCIGVARIKASTDAHMNDIPLCEWDALHVIVQTYAQRALLAAGDVCANSLGNSVCIAKAAARIIRDKGIDMPKRKD